MDKRKLEKHRLFVHEGKLRKASNGRLFNTSRATTLHTQERGRAMFVMDEHGNLYASKTQTFGKLHHSSFLSGRPVVSAGEIVVNNGVPEIISHKSGHYKPLEEHQERLCELLAKQGIDVDRIVFEVGFK